MGRLFEALPFLQCVVVAELAEEVAHVDRQRDIVGIVARCTGCIEMEHVAHGDRSAEEPRACRKGEHRTVARASVGELRGIATTQPHTDIAIELVGAVVADVGLYDGRQMGVEEGLVYESIGNMDAHRDRGGGRQREVGELIDDVDLRVVMHPEWNADTIALRDEMCGQTHRVAETFGKLRLCHRRNKQQGDVEEEEKFAHQVAD